MGTSRIDGRPPGLPTVSAIIPAYNASAFIHRTIESALAQTHHLLEIIVVDDGSTDNTVEVCSRYPVSVIPKNNGGPAAARNSGAKHATGEWLAFLDHDDGWHPDKTEIQLGLVNDAIDAVFCEKSPGSDAISFMDMFWHNYGGNPSGTIVRAEVLRSLGMFDEDPSLIGVDDYNFWLRFMLKGHKFAVSPQCYSFTPADNHLGGNPQKMINGELANIEKIGMAAGIDRGTIEARKRVIRREYIPSLIGSRKLGEARKHLLRAGISTEMMKCWTAALCPVWMLDMRRRLTQRADIS